MLANSGVYLKIGRSIRERRYKIRRERKLTRLETYRTKLIIVRPIFGRRIFRLKIVENRKRVRGGF